MRKNKTIPIYLWEVEAEENKIINIYEPIDQQLIKDMDTVSVQTSTLYPSRAETGVLDERIQTDYEHPIVFRKSKGIQKGTLYIHPEYYVDHKEDIDIYLQNVFSQVDSKSLRILDPIFATKPCIEAVGANEQVEHISIGTRSKPYSLDASTYLTCKKYPHIKSVSTVNVDQMLQGIVGDIIDRNNEFQILGRSYNSYRNKRKITIFDIPNDLSNIKHIPYCVEEIEFMKIDISKLGRIIEEIYKYHPRILFKLSADTQKIPSEFIQTLSCKDHVYISYLGKETKGSDYVKNNEQLQDYVQPILESGLSPFEKYLYIYNKVKQFKEYKENEDDKFSARNLYAILSNEYIVCVGFAELLCDLLYRVGIPIQRISTKVDVYNNEELNDSIFTGHSRAVIYLQDPKYGIDGYYFADPTWDNDLKHDLYVHAIMTPEEDTRQNKLFYWNHIDLLNVSTLEDFIEKVTKYPKSLQECIHMIFKMDDSFYKSLLVKYPYLQQPDWVPEDPKLYVDVYTYLYKKCNHEVKGESIIEAAMTVRQFENRHLTSEEYDAMKREMIRINKEHYSLSFPQMMKENHLGQKEVVANQDNKFDIEDAFIHKNL